jgi:hypothetical protein
MTKDNKETVINQGESPPVPAKASSTPTAEAAPPAIQSLGPDEEIMSYMGIDSSSVNEIQISQVDGVDVEQKKMETWVGDAKKPVKKGQKMPTERLIAEGIELIRSISSEANKVINMANKTFADRAIAIGQICIKLKELIRGNEKPWGAWAEENLPFIAKRNREKYMLIGSRPDCWPFSFLGVDRLEMLCSVTKGVKGNDPIGDLLGKYEIPFSDALEVNMSEFKAMIDAAINQERLVKNGLTINFNLVTNIVNLGVDFDKSLIRRLTDIKDCGGNPESLLEKISLTGGREDMDVTPEKRLQDFNALTNRLIKTLDFIMGDQDQIVKIDRETFQLLLEKLVSIQDMVILDAKAEQAV